MEISLKKYRIKKKYEIEYDENVAYFYPQYKTRFFGWIYLHESIPGPFIFADMNGVLFLFTILGTVAIFFGIFLVWILPILGSLLLGIPSLIWFFIYYRFLKTTKGDFADYDFDKIPIKKYSTLEKAKNYINKRLKEEEKRLNAIAEHENLDEEVYFMNVKVERYHKLKKLKRRMKI